jgi:hypothetical protein
VLQASAKGLPKWSENIVDVHLQANTKVMTANLAWHSAMETI